MYPTALVLNDLYQTLCVEQNSQNTEETYAMRVFVQGFILCSNQCQEPSRQMKDAQSDCDFIRATLNWLPSADKMMFQRLTARNIDDNLKILASINISQSDLLELNALIKDNELAKFQERMEIIMERVHTYEQSTLFALMSLVALSRIPSHITRSTNLSHPSPGQISVLGESGILVSQNATPITDGTVIYKGEVVFSNESQLFKLTPMVVDRDVSISFNGEHLMSSSNQMFLPMPRNSIGFIIHQDWMLLDINSGHVWITGIEEFESELENFATRTLQLKDGEINITLMNGVSYSLTIIPLPTLDPKEREKERAFEDYLMHNLNQFPGVTTSLANL